MERPPSTELRSEGAVGLAGSFASNMMIEKMRVVAPTTAVPMSTGLAVALNVLPAPSLASRKCLPASKSGSKPKSRLTSSLMPGVDSMSDSSNTDWALSVTGPYESTAMVTGPMPRKPKATRPNANTPAASGLMTNSGPWKPMCETQYAMAMRPVMAMPSQ